MQEISAYILAFNEAAKIAAAVQRTVGGRDRGGRFRQHRSDRGSPKRLARAWSVPFAGFGDLRNRAIAECRTRLDLQSRCRRALHGRTCATRFFGRSSRPAPERRLPGAAPQLHDGTLDQRLRLVPELPAAAAVPAARCATEDPVHEGYELLTAGPLGRLQNAIGSIRSAISTKSSAR